MPKLTKMSKEEQKRRQSASWKIYFRTKKGVSASLYGHIRARKRDNTNKEVDYSLKQFRDWLSQTNFDKIFIKWESLDHPKNEYPSVDRIDCLEGYQFSNMQVIPYKENRKKGEQEKLILWGKKIFQYSMDDELIAIYPSIKHAWMATGISRGNISSVAGGARESAGGYKWKFDKKLKNGKKIIRIRRGVPQAFLRRR